MEASPKVIVLKFQAISKLIDLDSIASKVRFKNKEFVRKELKRTALDVVERYHSFPVNVLKAVVEFHVSRRCDNFGMIDRLFQQHKSIPKQYVSKLGGFERIGWERSDILQELNIKAVMTIKAWGRRWKEYRITGRYKPVPMPIFLRTAMSNRMKDFFKYVEREPHVQEVTYASEGGAVDIICNQTEIGETIIDLQGKRLVICGEDILQGLGTKKEKAIFILNFMGFKPTELDRKFGKCCDFLPSQLVYRQQERLFKNTQLRLALGRRVSEIVF